MQYAVSLSFSRDAPARLFVVDLYRLTWKGYPDLCVYTTLVHIATYIVCRERRYNVYMCVKTRYAEASRY